MIDEGIRLAIVAPRYRAIRDNHEYGAVDMYRCITAMRWPSDVCDDCSHWVFA